MRVPDSLPNPISGSITVTRVAPGGVGDLFYDAADVPTFSLPDTLETLQTDTIPVWPLFPLCEKLNFGKSRRRGSSRAAALFRLCASTKGKQSCGMDHRLRPLISQTDWDVLVPAAVCAMPSHPSGWSWIRLDRAQGPIIIEDSAIYRVCVVQQGHLWSNDCGEPTPSSFWRRLSFFAP